MIQTGRFGKILAIAMSVVVFAASLPILGLSAAASALPAANPASYAALNPPPTSDSVVRLTKTATPHPDFLESRSYDIELSVNSVQAPIVIKNPINYIIIFDTYDVMQGNLAFEFVLSNISSLCRRIWEVNKNATVSVISYSAPKNINYGSTEGSINDAVIVADKIDFGHRGTIHQALMNYNRSFPFVDFEKVQTSSFQGYRVYGGLGNSQYDNYDYVYLDKGSPDIYKKPQLIHRMYEVDGVRKPYCYEPTASDNITDIYYPIFKRDSKTGCLLDESNKPITPLYDSSGLLAGFSKEPVLIGKEAFPTPFDGTTVSYQPIRISDAEGIFYTDPATGRPATPIKMIPSASITDKDNKSSLFTTNTNPEAAIAQLEKILESSNKKPKDVKDKVVFITDAAPSAAIGMPIYNWAQSGTGTTDGVKAATEAVNKRIDKLMAKYNHIEFVPIGLGGFSSAHDNLRPYFDGRNKDGSNNPSVVGLLEKLGEYSGGLFNPDENVFSVELANSTINTQREHINSVFKKAKLDLGIGEVTLDEYAYDATITDTIPATFVLDETSLAIAASDGKAVSPSAIKVIHNSDGSTTLSYFAKVLKSGDIPTKLSYTVTASDKVFGGSGVLVPTNRAATLAYTTSEGAKNSCAFPQPAVYIPYIAAVRGGEDTVLKGTTVSLCDYITAKTAGASAFTAAFDEKDLPGRFIYTWRDERGTLLHSSPSPEYAVTVTDSTTYTLTIESAAVPGYINSTGAPTPVTVQPKLSLKATVTLHVIENTITIQKLVQSKVAGVSPDILQNDRFGFTIDGPVTTNAILKGGESKTLSGFTYGSYQVNELSTMNYQFDRVCVVKDGRLIGFFNSSEISVSFLSDVKVSQHYKLIYLNNFVNEEHLFDYNSVDNMLKTNPVHIS